MTIKAIIFDYGRTIFDPETDNLLQEVKEVLNTFKEEGPDYTVTSLQELLSIADSSVDIRYMVGIK